MIEPVANFMQYSMMTLAAVNIEGNISEAEDAIAHFFASINSTNYNLTHFILNSLFLIICFAIKFSLYFKVIDIDTSTQDGKKLMRRYKNYVLIHIILSYIFAFLVCYLLVALVNSKDVIILWNTIVAPLIGFVSSVWLNNNVLIKYESEYKLLKNPLSDIDKEDKDKKEDHHDHDINININNGDQSTDDKFVLSGDESLPDSKRIEATINRIIDVQKEQSVILEKHTKELKEQNTMLKNMQSLMKNNIKFELEDMIYHCLNRGYVTPSEDKKIRVKYRDYVNNEGNGDLKDLYESRYLDLDVHDHPICKD